MTDFSNDKKGAAGPDETSPEPVRPNKNVIAVQRVWGVALLMAGIGVFFRIPQVMPKITETYPQFAQNAGFIKFCFYLIGAMLIGGAVKKLYVYFWEYRN